MKENDAQVELCLEVLRRLDHAGVLKDVVLVGSWCIHFYREGLPGKWVVGPIRTEDMDILIPTPVRTQVKVDLAELLADLDFVKVIRGDGYTRLNGPNLTMDFLVPERGRGSDGPFRVPLLGITAQPLRFLDFVIEDTVFVNVEGVKIRLPHPHRFGLHKLIVSERRPNKDKAAHDREQGVDVLMEAKSSGEGEKVKALFDSLPKGWRSIILKALRKNADSDTLVELFS
jgi:hypothetical protein